MPHFPFPPSALQEQLEVLLTDPLRGVAIRGITRSPSEYASSAELDELTLHLADGRTIELMLKRIGPDDGSDGTKPVFIVDPRREAMVYEHVLARADSGAPRWFGTLSDESQREWLLLERVGGEELYQLGKEHWQCAAHWLAVFQAHTSPLAAALPEHLGRHLLRYDGSFFSRWISRAVDFQRSTAARHQFQALQQLASHYDRVVERLLGMRQAFVHGEYYASNILINRHAQPPRVCPVDWETAGLGPAPLDLAALTSGNWNATEQQAMAAAYMQNLSCSAEPDSAEWVDWKYCRLQIAVQWLGWAPRWSPPRAHAADWLTSAIQLSEELSLL